MLGRAGAYFEAPLFDHQAELKKVSCSVVGLWPARSLIMVSLHGPYRIDLGSMQVTLDEVRPGESPDGLTLGVTATAPDALPLNNSPATVEHIPET